MNKTQTSLTHAIIDSAIRKVDYWLNQLNTNKDEPTIFFETPNFIWDIAEPAVNPGLTINHPKQIVKIWWTPDTVEKPAEFFTNIEFSAEDNLTFYIELEQLIINDLKVLEEMLNNYIQTSFDPSGNNNETFEEIA